MPAFGTVAQPCVRHETTPIPSDSASLSKESGATCLVFVALTLGAAAMGCLLAQLPAAGHDQMWFLMMAQRLLHGARLYGPEAFDSNPPLIVWLSTLPGMLAAWLHLPATAIGKALIVAVEIGIWMVCLRIVRTLWPGLSRTAIWALAFAYISIFAVMPARDFGQREHLLALLCVPYLLAAACAIEGRRLRGGRAVLIGIAAGVGLALKPHQLLIPAAVEAIVLWRGRRARSTEVGPFLRPELLALVATCATYLAAIRIFTPQYLTQVLPILRDTYWAIGGLSMGQLFLQAIQLHILAIIAVALYVMAGRAAREQSSMQTVAAVSLAAGIAATVAYYLQGTGWYYQQLPALSFFALAAWIELMQLASSLQRHPHNVRHSTLRWMPFIAAFISILAVALTARFSGYSFARPLQFPSGIAGDPDPSFFAGLAPGMPVAILTTEVDLSIPPVYTHNFFWAQRTNNLWLLPSVLRNESPASGDREHRIPPARLFALDRTQHTWMVEDLTRWRPQLILVERCQDPSVHCQILEDRHDNLLAWFARDPNFRAIFAHYHYLRSSGPFDAYTLD